jgi:hypothetical protein
MDHRLFGKCLSRVLAFTALLFLAGIIVLPGLMYASSGVTSYKMIEATPPGTTSPYPSAVNKSNAVVGETTAADGTTQGFELKGGKYTTIIVPGSNGFTRANGINDSGVVVGDFFLNSDNAYHGYLMKGKKFTQYDVQLGTLSTSLFAINNAGNMAGSVGANGQPNQGFVDIGGNVTEFMANGQSTYAYSINSSNQVAGDYYDSNGYPHCFYRDASGTISLINAPNTYLTACFGINDGGEIAGIWVDFSGQIHGFLDTAGAFTELPFYWATSLNNAGSVVGIYLGPGSANGVQFGFLAEPKAFASYASVQLSGAQSTAIYGINDKKSMVGTYTDGGGASHGLLFAKNKVTNIDDPSAQAGTTAAYGINSAGDIVGGYTNGGGVGVGFYYTNGTYSDIAPAGSQYTNPAGINDSGEIAGLWVDGSGNGHGFTYNGSKYTSLDVPGSTFTGCWGINNSGQVTCQYGDQYGVINSALYNGSSFTTIDVPGAFVTAAHSINKDGNVVFLWQDVYGNNHGALLDNGSYYVFDVPASAGSSTDADGINDSGELVGHFTPTGSSNTEGWQGKL